MGFFLDVSFAIKWQPGKELIQVQLSACTQFDMYHPIAMFFFSFLRTCLVVLENPSHKDIIMILSVYNLLLYTLKLRCDVNIIYLNSFDGTTLWEFEMTCN